jgi:hypothetical protein
VESGDWPGCVNEVFSPVTVGAIYVDCFAVLLGWVGIQYPVMFEEFLLLTGRQILISEEHNTSLN